MEKEKLRETSYFINNLNLSKAKPNAFFAKFLGRLRASRLFFLFLVIFLICNGIYYKYYSDSLLTFTQTVKVYKIEDALQKYPTETLTDKIYSPTKETEKINNAGYVPMFIMWGSLELFLIFSVVRHFRRTRKILLAGYFLIMQPLLIVPLLTLIAAQGSVVGKLLAQASQEIPDRIEMLTSQAKLGSLGVEHDPVVIKAKIASQSILPIPIEDNTKQEAIYRSYSIASGSADTFYRAIAMPYQLNYDSNLANKKEAVVFDSLLFPDNTLIVQTVSSGVMNGLIPFFSTTLVKNYFSTAAATVKEAPIVDTPDPEKYLAIRKKENEKQRNEIVELVQSTKNDLSGIDKNISDTEECEQKNSAFYDDLRGRIDTWYTSCVSDLGASNPICSKAEFEVNLTAIARNRDECREYKIKFSDLRPKFVSNLAFAQKILANFDANPILPEYEGGVFLPPRTIHLRFDPIERYPFSYYLAAGVHEELHFLSYNSKEKQAAYLPHFLEEGITDYLAKEARDRFFNKDSGQASYFVEIQIVKKIEELLGRDELETIYFTKDSALLKRLIDKKVQTGTYDSLVEKGKILSLTKLEDVVTRLSLTREMLDILSGKETINYGSSVK